MLKRYIQSQTRDSVRLFVGFTLLATVVAYLFSWRLMPALSIGLIAGTGITLLYLTLTYHVLKKGMLKASVQYAVTRSGKMSGNSRIFFCRREGNKLVSTNATFPMDLRINQRMAKALEQKGYFYKREGMANYFIFKGDW